MGDGLFYYGHHYMQVLTLLHASQYIQVTNKQINLQQRLHVKYNPEPPRPPEPVCQLFAKKCHSGRSTTSLVGALGVYLISM